MQLFTQPANSSICGHCCVAMVLDHLYPSLGFCPADVINEIGHKRGTHFRDLEEVFQNYYVDADHGKPIVGNIVLPEMCIISYYFNKEGRSMGGHWILVYRGVVYDPSAQEPIPGDVYQRIYQPSLTTYHEIRGYV